MLKKIHTLIILCLLGLLLMLGSRSTTIYAQGTPEPELNPERITITLAELGYDNLRLQGLYGTTSLWIPFQSNWPIEGNTEIELTYRGSPLLNSNTAIVTVFAGDLEVSTFRPVGDNLDHTVVMVITPEQRQAGGVTLTFYGHLRLTDKTCEDSFNIGQWLIIRNSSQISINLAETPAAPELTDLPQAVAVQGSNTPPPIIFVLPDEPDDLTLTVAAQVATRLGTSITTNHLPIYVATANSLTEQDRENATLVLIGLRDNQSLIDELSQLMPIPPTEAGFVSEDNVLIPPTDGVIQIFSSPWQPRHNILLISGNGAEGLSMAGQALADQDTFHSLTGSFHFVHNLVDRPESAKSPPWLTRQTTFSQLGESDRNAMGLGMTNVNYFFQYPSGIIFDQSGQIVLHLAFSPALREQGSYVEVSVNGMYVGAVSAQRVGGDAWVSLDLPVQALNKWAGEGHVRQLDVQLSIANLLPTDNCEQINAESSWTKIYADSYFQFEHLPAELPDLYYFPYPFVFLDDPAPTRLIIPTEPSTEELQTALSLVALMGNQALTDLSVDVVRDTAVTPEMYADHHLILIGSLTNNKSLQDAIAERQTNLPDDIYQVLQAPQVGFFHAFSSPWDDKMSVLAIYSETEAGFKTVADSLYKQGKLVNESGSIAMVRPSGEPSIVYREVGLSQPQMMQPDIVLSEISQQGGPVAEPTSTAVVSPSELNSATGKSNSVTVTSLTNTERLILVITAFLIILVAVAALLRIAWRIRA